MRDTELLDTFRRDVAPATEATRARARAQLLEAIEHEPGAMRARTRRPRRRLLVLAAAVCAAAMLVVVEPWHTTSRNVARAASAMVDVKRGTILHLRADGHNIYTPFSEQWLAADGSWREQHGGSNASGPCTVEDGFDAPRRVMSSYDPPTNSIYWRKIPLAQGQFAAPITQLRGWLTSGQLRAAGKARIGGRNVTRLVPTHGKTLLGVQAYYVDSRTSAPVRWQINGKQWYDYTIYEQLPATRKNTALTSINALHPNATQHRGWGAPGGCGSG
jgi:hypothetical protein